MDVNVITGLIANLGFPVVMCVLFFYRMNQQDDKYNDTIQSMKISLDLNTQTISSNNKLLHKVLKQLGVDTDE